MVSIELTELIGSLRSDLAEAIKNGENADLQFELGPIELQLTVSAEKEAKGGAKVRFWVVDANAEAKAKWGNSQRITVTLTPRSRVDPATTPLVSGSELRGEG